MKNVQFSDDFVVEDLGVQEEYVYDIEVEDNHNFFANDICVHNSIYLRLEKVVNQKFKNEENKAKIIDFLDKFSKEVLKPYIDKKYEELRKYTNAYANKMIMNRECIADRGLWTAKKRYCLNVHDSEGVRYHEPKLKIMGIEVQRSSTPKICRSSLKNCIKIILTENEESLIDFVQKFKKDFYSSEIYDISSPRGVRDLKKYSDSKIIYKKGTPIAVKGALLYNYHIEQKKLEHKYQKITNGDKVKFLYLKEPNTIQDKVFSYSSRVPSELNIEKYIDYDTQFEKSFLDPLSHIIKPIGWNYEKKIKIDSLFD